MNLRTINWSSLQFGLPLNDAFGVIVILQTMCILTDVIFGIVYWFPPSQGVAWFTLICLMISVEPIIFAGFFCWGFIWKGDAWTLRLWIILATILDLLYIILMFFAESDDDDTGEGTTTSIFWAVDLAVILTLIIFRGYIYLVSWLVWKELSEGGEVKGFGQGLLQLGQYYKGEFCRIASILFFVEIMWNLVGTLVFDFLHGIELHLHSSEKDGSLLFRPIIPLRIGRIVLALLGLYFLRNEGVRGLKFVWLPCQVVSTLAGLGLFIFVALFADQPDQHVHNVSIYCTECFLNLFQNGVLFYCVIQLVMSLRPIVSPVSLVPAPPSSSQQEIPSEA